MSKRSVVPGILLLLVLAGGLACAGRAFERARQEDTAAAYAQFLREHPGSRYAQEARERSALVRVRANPGPTAYEAFLERYPQSPLVPELRALVEEAYFRRARAAGSAEAYRRFLEEFGDGPYAARARGNAVYLEARGFAGDPEALARFAAEHPQSDFAPEAKRSAEALEARSRSAFRQVGLEIRIASGTPGADRLARVFTERAREAYSAAGLRLVPAGDGSGPAVRLRIEHREERVRSQLDAAAVTSPGILATTRVELERADDEQPIWSEEFSFRTVGAVREADSILFGPGAQSYWSSFFVPAVSWSSQAAARSPHRLEKPVVAVDATSTHAFTLFADGDFRVFEIGDPEQPMPVAEYRRERDLTTWSGLRVVGNRVLIFGEDGIEVVALGSDGPKRVAAWGRGEVGSIHDVEPVRGGLVLAGKRGLLFLPEEDGGPQVLLDRPVPGLARLGDRLVFTDGSSLYVSTIPLLRQQRVEGELRLGAGFGPERVRVRGRTALVWGERGLVQVSLARPSAPTLLSRVEATEVGTVRDALLVRGRLFLLGDRGLQLADARGEHVVDAVEVSAAARLDASGRHLVMVGDQSIQVVDTTPLLLAGASPASPESDPEAAE